jgi:hypothetical protein
LVRKASFRALGQAEFGRALDGFLRLGGKEAARFGGWSGRNAEIDRMGRKVNSIHQGIQGILEACANELECEKPQIAKQLRSIGDRLAHDP